MLAVRDDLESDILQSTSHLRKLKLQYDDLRTTSLSSHSRNRTALTAMESHITQQRLKFQSTLDKNEDNVRDGLKVQLQELHASRNKTAILGDLIPMLITGSGIDWANDQELVDIMISCGSVGLDLNEKEELDDIIFS